MQYTKEERLKEGNNFNLAVQCFGLTHDSQWADKAL